MNGVNSGSRTHDLQGHNLALYQLSYIHHMVRLEGIEPPTYALEGRCSILLSYRRIKRAGIIAPHSISISIREYLIPMERVKGIEPS